MRQRYELGDDQWDKMKDLLPAERKAQGGRPAKDNRTMINAMLWIARSGAPWRDLPEYYGPWKSVYTRFRRWEKAGVFHQVLECLASEPDLESLMIDASIVRVHQHGAGAKGGQTQVIGRSRGGITTKIHTVVDALGCPLRIVLSPGNTHDSVIGYEMLRDLDLTDKQVIADRGYDSNRILDLLKEQQATSVIPPKKNRVKQRKCDWWLYKEPHLVECFVNKLKYRRLATRYEKLACTFAAFLSLASSLVWLA
ncbi:IS5 family transposase [Paenibacillus lemnae]|uniref:IS5 family transposase n=1 Tax=Paenibacillus lemnae TaxID=1330551 RepID=UPI001B7D5690|nr:IS5 family transposase [Paenibacillus lemnae]